ncbi:MAG TPA: tetratricopeptide repeat protein [Gemmatimonadaceae bacterium]|nr:tetratricopeptide repeat protein [Gemmatimonadaceae bacterium]
MSDEIRIWSDELARDPSSLVFLPLAETLRRVGQLDMARKVALRGIERHPANPDAHDQLARIHADAGAFDEALSEWQMVRRIVPGHLGAIKGMAFIRFHQGDRDEAERLLIEARNLEGEDADIAAAITAVRRSGAVTPLDVPAIVGPTPTDLFADVLPDAHAALLLDADGGVVAGRYQAGDGRDVSAAVGAALTGVSGEAQRATKHLQIGAWRAIVFETESAIMSLAPAPAEGPAAGGLVVLSAPPATPLGMLRRLLDRCIERGREAES